MVDLAPGQQREQALRDGGFTDDEINSWKGSAADTMQKGGFSAKEVRDYFGQKEPDMSGAQAVVKQNLAKSQANPDKPKREPIDTSAPPMEAKDMLDAMAAGWGNSFSGLFSRKAESPIQVSPNATYAQTFVSGAAQLLGDSPAMAAGMVAGSELGPVGAAAGGFAAPAAMRKVLIDHYRKGDIQDAGEFARRVVDTTWEATKGAVTGAVTELSGGLGGALAGTAGRLSSQIAAQTAVSSALEGKLPSKRDFINGAIAIGGLHAVGYGIGKAGYITDKLMNIYSETGAHPNEVIEAANNDPHLKGELLSQNPDLPIEASRPAPEDAPVPEATPIEPDAAKDEILSRIGERPEPEKIPLKEQIKDGFASFYAKHLDYTKAVGDVLKEIGDQPLDEKNAQVLMRLHASVQDKIQFQMEHNTVDWNTRLPNGEGVLVPILEYQSATGDKSLDGFKAYGIAARSLELESRGIDQPGLRENDRTYIDAHPEIKPYFDRFVKAKERVLDYLGNSGRYSDEQIQAMKDLNQQHISFKKILEPDPITGKTDYTSRDIKRIGTSDLQFQDPMLSTIRDIGNMIKIAHETEATNAFVDAVHEPDSPFIKVSDNQQGIPGDTQIAGYVDGKRTLYDVPEEVADSLKRMAGNQPAINTWTKLLKPFAAMLRMGTVDNPLFALRHAWRNQLTAPTLSQTGLKPFEALLYAPEYLSKGDSYQQFVYDGGAINSIVPLNEGYLDGKIYQLDSKAPFLNKVWNKVKTAGEFSHWAIVMNDNIIRFAEYQRMLGDDATRAEAAFAAREVLPDFQKAGLQKSAIQSVTAFLNVHMQGMARMGQEMGSNPAGYIAKNLAYITVPSLLLMAAQHDDDGIKDLPNWQKYAYWPIHISNWRDSNSLAEAMSVKAAYPSNVRQMPDGKWQVNDGPIIRIQKPFTNGILFGSGIEAAMDAWQKKDPKGFIDFVKTVGGSTVVEPIPTALNPVLEHMVNRNFYTGSPIVRQSMESKLPEMQYDRYTSETAKILGKIIGSVPLVKDIGPQDARLASPKVIDNYLHGWSGTLGNYAIDALDKGLEKAGVVPEKVKPLDTLADIPFVKEFVIRFPNAHPQSVSDFEDRYRQATAVHNSINQLLKEGDVQGAVALQDKYQVNMARLTGADKAIQNMNAAIQKVNQTPDISPVEKRQLIDGLMYQMTSMAKEGNSLMDEFEKQVKTKKAVGQ